MARRRARVGLHHAAAGRTERGAARVGRCPRAARCTGAGSRSGSDSRGRANAAVTGRTERRRLMPDWWEAEALAQYEADEERERRPETDQDETEPDDGIDRDG